MLTDNPPRRGKSHNCSSQTPKGSRKLGCSHGPSSKRPERLVGQRRSGGGLRHRSAHGGRRDATVVAYPSAAHVGRVRAEQADVDRRHSSFRYVDAAAVQPHLARFATAHREVSLTRTKPVTGQRSAPHHCTMKPSPSWSTSDRLQMHLIPWDLELDGVGRLDSVRLVGEMAVYLG